MPGLLLETTLPIAAIEPEEITQSATKRSKKAKKIIKFSEHSHFVFAPNVEGDLSDPLASYDDNHSHPIFFNENTQSYELGASHGHTHNIIEFHPRPRRDKEYTDDEILAEIDNKHLESLEEHSDYKEKSERAEGLVSGIEEHWSESTKTQLSQEYRAHHTVNFILRNFLQASGLQRARRNDITPRPREGSDMFIADVLKHLIKGILHNNLFEYEETDAGDDQRITGRGNLRCVWSTERDLNGEILIEHKLWDMCHYAPHNRKDLKDCPYVIFHEWKGIHELAAQYPKKADQIEDDFQDVVDYGGKFEQEQKDRTSSTTSRSVRPLVRLRNGRLKEWYDIDKKRLLELEFWKKVVVGVDVAVHEETDFYFGMEGLSEQDIASIKTIPGMEVIPQKKYELWRAVVAGGTVLEHDYMPSYEDILPGIAFYAFKRRNVIFGIVWPAEDLQLALNKLYSQVNDIINSAANYCEYYDNNTFFSKKEETNWKKYGSRPGYKAKVKNLDRLPQQRAGTKVPVELFQLIVLFDQTLSRIMSINPEQRGETGRAESGRAIEKKVAQGVQGQEYIFDNSRLALINLGKLIIKLIQSHYSVDRIMRELEAQNSIEEFKINGKKYKDYEKEEIRRNLESNPDLTKYDISVDISPTTPSVMLETFDVLIAMRSAGLNIPDDVIIPFIPGLSYKEKEEAIERTRARLDAEERRAQQLADSQIEMAKVTAQGKMAAAAINQNSRKGGNTIF